MPILGIVPKEQKSKTSSDLHYAIVISLRNHGTAKTAPDAIVMSRLILDILRLRIFYVFVSSSLYLLSPKVHLYGAVHVGSTSR